MRDDNSSDVLAELGDIPLRQLVEKFFTTSFNPILITTAEPGYPILYANPAFCQMCGYELEELIGRSPKLLQGEMSNHRILQRMREDLSAGLPFHGAITNYRKDGQSYPVEWNISPILNADGKVSHYISIQKDLSKLKRLVSRLKSTNEHFRAFLRDLVRSDDNQATNDSSGIGAVDEFTGELLDNSRIYNPALRSDANVDLFETEFFDGDGDINGMLGDSLEHEKLNARQYAERHSVSAADVSELQGLIVEIQEHLDLLEFSSNKSKQQLVVAENLQELANTIFYLEDFVSISSVLSELASRCHKHTNSEQPEFIVEIYHALMVDLQTWIESVFVEQTADDIHEFDASIISSAKQLLMFLP